MSLIAAALDKAMRPNLCIYEVQLPSVLSTWSLVAMVPSRAVFLSSEQCFRECSDPELDKYLFIAFFSFLVLDLILFLVSLYPLGHARPSLLLIGCQWFQLILLL